MVVLGYSFGSLPRGAPPTATVMTILFASSTLPFFAPQPVLVAPTERTSSLTAGVSDRSFSPTDRFLLHLA
jgi:hypothetical protein